MFIVSSKINHLRKRRFDEIKKRKSFLPSVVITVFLWLTLIFTILLVDPGQKGSLELFFGTLLFAGIFTFSLLLGNTRRGFLVSIALVFFLFLRYLGVGSFLNLALIIGVVILFEYAYTSLIN